MLVACRDFLIALLDADVSMFNDMTLRLYQNDYTPLDTSDVSDFTEATFSGYAAIATNAWGGAFLNASNITEIDETLRTFTHNGGGTNNNIYGYYLTDAGGNLTYAERYSGAPVAMDANGKTFSVVPRFTTQNQ